jgi:hypothetical protein
MDAAHDLAGNAGIHDRLAVSHPKLSRGTVWCTTCGWSQSVSAAYSLKHGWPKCCGYTMTIDSPEERAPSALYPKG